MLPSDDELKSQLRMFNILGYTDESTRYRSNGKNGKILTIKVEQWEYEDEFYGGEPYSGNETMWINDKDVFRCVYWGKVIDGINFTDIYAFLREALREGPSGACVHRGPEKYSADDLMYTNECLGCIGEFFQTERIFINGKEVYTAYFIGGRVNVKTE